MISIKNLSKTYKAKNVETKALKKISFEIKEGDFLSIIGTSGSGKSTLLNVLGCMDYFDEGEYNFYGVKISQLTEKELAKFRNKKIGFIFQSFNLVNTLNILNNIEVPMGYAGIKAKKRRKRSTELLSKMQILEKAKAYPSQLSSGQQQRVAIARALSNNPNIILADEPTGNLDSNNTIVVMEILKKLNNEGKTIILVTHDSEVAEYTSRTIELKDGVIIRDE